MFKLKNFAALLAAGLVLLAAVPASAAGPAGLTAVEDAGQTYYDVTSKADLRAAAQYSRDNFLETLPVCFQSSRDWDSSYGNNVVNYFDYYTQGVFTYRQYSVDSVSAYDNYEKNGYLFGQMELVYLDTKEELARADAKIDAVLSGISGKSTYDKLLYIAEYVCKQAQYGSQQLPDGGYDAINGVCDVLSGVRTNTVCTSYALTFQRFMEKAGINSYILGDDGHHAWNIVELDGKWYGVDCTWGDLGDSLNRQYFLMGRSAMQGNYAFGSSVDPIAIFARNHTISASNYGSSSAGTSGGNGGTQNATQPAAPSATDPETSPESTDPVTEQSTESGGMVFTIDVSQDSSVSREVFEQAKQAGKTLALKGENYTWTFPAEYLTKAESFPDTFDTAIVIGDALNTANSEQIKKAAGDVPCIGFRFAHHGELPCIAGISLELGADWANRAVTVYTLNDSGEAVVEAERVVGENGILTFETDHCSLWFVTQADVESGAAIAGWVWALIAVGVALAAAAGVFCWWYFIYRKHQGAKK